MQQFNGRSRTFGLHVGGVSGDMSSALLRGEDFVAHEQLTGLSDPVLAECRLHAVHDGAAQPNAYVGKVLPVLRAAEPTVDDAVAAEERRATVDDDDLAVIALAEDADVAPVERVELLELAAGVLELLLDRFAHLAAAFRVEQRTNSHAGPRARAKGIGEALAQHAFLPKKRLEVHRVAGRGNLLHQNVEVRAVLEYFDAVAVHGSAERKSGKRRNQLVDRRVALDMQSRVTVSLDRPDHQDEQDYDAEDDQRDHCICLQRATRLDHRISRRLRLSCSHRQWDSHLAHGW